MPVERVSNLLYDAGNAGLRALFDQASLPPSTYPAFKEAIEAMREGAFMIEPGGAARLKRRMIERVLTRCEGEDIGDLAPLLTLLRRFATEAAREEARLFCDELVAAEFSNDRRFKSLPCRQRGTRLRTPEGARYLPHHFSSRRFEALAFGLHPLREFGGQLRQRRLGTRYRIVIVRGRLRDRLVQRVRRRNDFVVGERRD